MKMGKTCFAREWLAMVLVSCSLAGVVSAQTFTTIKSFGILTNMTGTFLESQLVQGPDGTLYGIASSGPGYLKGTVFKVQPDGSNFTVLKWFTNSLELATP